MGQTEFRPAASHVQLTLALEEREIFRMFLPVCLRGEIMVKAVVYEIPGCYYMKCVTRRSIG